MKLKTLQRTLAVGIIALSSSYAIQATAAPILLNMVASRVAWYQ